MNIHKVFKEGSYEIVDTKPIRLKYLKFDLKNCSC